MPLKPELTGELRGLVREVLREAMAGKASPGLGAIEAVRIGCDADLQAFAARVAEPQTAERVRSGKLKFTLAGAGSGAATAAASGSGAPLTGVISEKTIDRIASASTLVIAGDAVLTPLARDRARKLGLKIERRR
ncbi:MAG: hypothetical protein FJX63_07255 [Alphaproteobacteria bacterium]|nr:hypothetical protein [Alphaproteobacteria bacterium]